MNLSISILINNNVSTLFFSKPYTSKYIGPVSYTKSKSTFPFPAVCAFSSKWSLRRLLGANKHRKITHEFSIVEKLLISPRARTPSTKYEQPQHSIYVTKRKHHEPNRIIIIKKKWNTHHTMYNIRYFFSGRVGARVMYVYEVPNDRFRYN